MKCFYYSNKTATVFRGHDVRYDKSVKRVAFLIFIYEAVIKEHPNELYRSHLEPLR